MSNIRMTRLERAKERMEVWIRALPETLQSDAAIALDHLMLTAKSEIDDAYGDGYRLRKDETDARKAAA